MHRRQALQHLVILTSAAALLPGCQPEEKAPVYARVPLDRKQRKLLEQFTEALLPIAKTEVKTPEKTVDFTLTVLNDCHSPEDIEKYLAGLTELQTHLQQKYRGKFEALSTEQQAEVFTFLSGKEGVSEPLKFFFETTRDRSIEHLTSSEFFMKNVLDWEFAPGRYAGCAPVSTI
jgi:hypothetical protein